MGGAMEGSPRRSMDPPRAHLPDIWKNNKSDCTCEAHQIIATGP